MEKGIRDRNRELFLNLLAFAERNEYSDEYLKNLIEFWNFLPENEPEGNIFYAKYALAHGNYKVALEYAEKAYCVRKINLELWRILRDCYMKMGNYERALLFAGFAGKFYGEPINLDIPQEQLAEAMNLFSLAMGRGNYAPVASSRMRMTDQGVQSEDSIFAGEFLPVGETSFSDLFAGAFVERGLKDAKGLLLDFIKDSSLMARLSGADFVYDLIKVEKKDREGRITVGNKPVIIGLVGSTALQQVDFRNHSGKQSLYLGKWAASFFRVTESSEITSKHHFFQTRPIVLKHDDTRCKVVLNILLDGFCWRAVQDQDYEIVPNILGFFRKGVIFNQHYSVAEYTYPSLTTIETGLYPPHSQIFNEQASHKLNSEYVTLSEQLHELGYYCVNIMGDGAGVYNGTMRGYDRMIINAFDNRISIGVDRLLHHLEAFSDVDQFVFLHASDTHLWDGLKYQLPLPTQTVCDLSEMFVKKEEALASVYLPDRMIYRHWNQQGIKDCDVALKRLFDYLETHYKEDEYLITLYSDHGSGIYDGKKYLLSAYQTGATFMMRGRGVPHLGFTDELTSAVDIYPAIGKCLGFPAQETDGNLPAALGGQPREYTVSMSMFPGKPFRICIRNQDYECRAESQENLDEDGRADLADMKMALYRRNCNEQIHDEAVEGYFRNIIHNEADKIDNYGTQWPEMRTLRKKWFPDNPIGEVGTTG